MKKEIADRWVEALRSGRYKQGKRSLYIEETGAYCCLGVLCHIEGIESDVTHSIRSKNNPLRSTEGFIESLYVTLTVLNDRGSRDVVEPLTFDEIADVIQMTWEEL